MMSCGIYFGSKGAVASIGIKRKVSFKNGVILPSDISYHFGRITPFVFSWNLFSFAIFSHKQHGTCIFISD
jgi:hypothetical protein